MNPITVEVLADIEAGFVARYPHDMYLLPDSAFDSPEKAQQYRQTVHLLVGREWAMPVAQTGARGETALRLTTIGEQRLIEARLAVAL